MTATATERWSDLTEQRNEDGTITATRSFDVVNASDQTEAFTAVISGGVQDGLPVPVKDDEHPLSSELKAKNITADKAGFTMWRLNVEYRGFALYDLPVYEWNPVLETIGIEFDINGNPIVNSANEPFENPEQKIIGSWELIVERIEPYFNIQQANTFINTINATQITIPTVGYADAGGLFCRSIGPVTKYTVNDTAMRIRYEFWAKKPYEFADGTTTSQFQTRVMDKGFNRRVGGAGNPAAGKLQPIVDGDGNPVGSAQLLGGDGLEFNNTADTGISAPAGAVVETTSYAVFLHYQKYASTNYAGLQLFT